MTIRGKCANGGYEEGEGGEHRVTALVRIWAEGSPKLWDFPRGSCRGGEVAAGRSVLSIRPARAAWRSGTDKAVGTGTATPHATASAMRLRVDRGCAFCMGARTRSTVVE